MTGRYDTALICLNGHVISEAMRRYPEDSRKFCDECGAASISTCPRCSQAIQGEYQVDGAVAFGPTMPAPAFCGECGAAFPWTEAKLNAARELIEESDELSPEEKARLKESVPDLMHDGPKTAVAVVRVKKAMMKIGRAAGEALQKILVDIASETVKKTMNIG